MIQTKTALKGYARALRTNMTNHEHILWYHLRCKQIHDIQFYRQRILGSFIVDFYAPSIRLVIEVDGSQHEEPHNKTKDNNRDNFLASTKIQVIRISNLDIIENLEGVLSFVENTIHKLKLNSLK